MRHLLRRISLMPKMLCVTVLMGIILWAAQDYVFTRELLAVSDAELTERLSSQVQEDRIRFDNYVEGYQQVLKLFVSRKSFQDHVLLDPPGGNEASPRISMEIPPWLPDAAVIRNFVHIHYAILMDGTGTVREIYQGWPEPLPQALRRPAPRLVRVSEDQSVLTYLDGAPFLVTSGALKDREGGTIAILMIAARLNDDFLDAASQGVRTRQRIMALASNDRQPMILASNKPDHIPAGVLLDELKDGYQIIGKNFFDWGGSELDMQFISLISKSEFAGMNKSILTTERLYRTIMSIMFILAFAVIFFVITRQVQQLTRQIVSFSQDLLGTPPQDTLKGDQLFILRQQFHAFTGEIVASRERLVRQAGELLREKTVYLDNILHSSTMSIVAIDTALHIKYFNPVAEGIFGHEVGDVLEKVVTETNIYKKLASPCFELIVNRDEEKKAYACVSRVETEESPQFLESQVSWILDKDNNFSGFLILTQDVTERKRAEEEKGKLEDQLQQAQKMESVGRLAGGVAHDFNNMLGVIIGHAELALMRVESDQQIHASLTEILKAGKRSANLTRQLLAFARRQTVVPEVLDLNETVESMLKMLQRLIGEDIQLSWQPKPDLWVVKVDPSQIDQILANLCVNARDAIAGVGKLSIETGNHVFDEEYCAGHLGFAPGEYVRLAVSDDGRGMDQETQSHIFEPFFTTKAAGEGTGLGLATVYGIVKQNKGFINVYSEPGKGTTFTIYLPRHAGKVEQAQAEAAAVPTLSGHETILLVEDESAILQMTQKMLEMQGYTVLAASTPGEALHLVSEHAGEIHLLVTDVIMPEMNGRDLAKKLQSLCPSLKYIFMSGYTADVIAHHGVLDEGVAFIQKPFSRQELAAKVRKVLESV